MRADNRYLSVFFFFPFSMATIQAMGAVEEKETFQVFGTKGQHRDLPFGS